MIRRKKALMMTLYIVLSGNDGDNNSDCNATHGYNDAGCYKIMVIVMISEET